MHWKPNFRRRYFAFGMRSDWANQGRNTPAALWEGCIWDSVIDITMTGVMPQAATAVSRSPSENISWRRVHMRHRWQLGIISMAFITASPKLSSKVSLLGWQIRGSEDTHWSATKWAFTMRVKRVPLCISLKASSRSSSFLQNMEQEAVYHPASVANTAAGKSCGKDVRICSTWENLKSRDAATVWRSLTVPISSHRKERSSIR